MKTNQLSKISIISLSLIISACTQPGEKTAIGAATGGAIGAGLGAIVGNQAGSTGGGLAIGAVAGASTGAYIANAMEAQDKGIREQDEAIERQEQTIKAQRAQIEELRRGTDSKFATGDKFASSGSFATKGIDTSKAAPGDLYLSPTGGSPSGYSAVTARSKYEPQGAISGSSPRASSNLNDTAISPVVEEKSIKPALEAPSLSEAPVVDSEPKPLLETDLVTSAPAAEPVIAAANNSEGISNSELKPLNSEPAALSQNSNSQECKDSDAEVKKADQATDAGDKLFHYRRALRLCPRDSKIHAAIGDLYLTLGRKDDAVFEYEEGLKVDPSSASLKSKLEAARG